LRRHKAIDAAHRRSAAQDSRIAISRSRRRAGSAMISTRATFPPSSVKLIPRNKRPCRVTLTECKYKGSLRNIGTYLIVDKDPRFCIDSHLLLFRSILCQFLTMNAIL